MSLFYRFCHPPRSGWSEPLSYNLKVAGSLLKQVYVAERLAPPTSVDVISSAYRSMWARARDPAYWARFVESGEWKKVGIYAVEAWGIFTIGEMVGCREELLSAYCCCASFRRLLDGEAMRNRFLDAS